MKRNLLLVLALGVGTAAFAQNRQLPATMPAPKMKRSASHNESTMPTAAQGGVRPHATGSSSSNRDVTKIKLASSPNMLSVLVGESHGLQYNKETNLLAMFHRRTQSAPGTSGYIHASYSTNGGLAWDSLHAIYTQDAPNNGRYPTGAIYNPAGNTVPTNAYGIVAGPITDGAGWQGNYFASEQFDATDNNQQVKLNSDPGALFQHMARIGSSAHSNGKAYVLGTNYDYNSTASVIPLNGAVVNVGTFNSGTNAFDWTAQNLYQDFAHDPNDDSQLFWALPNMGCSKDGSTCYVVFMGRDSVNDYGYSQPIIWQSNDGGQNWGKMPVFDFRTLTALTDSLIPTDQGTGPVIPMWSANQGWDVVVDGNNKPHIISLVYSASNQAADSIYNEMRMFDVFMQADGFWNAYNFGTLQTSAVETANSPYPDAGGWDARIQGSRNAAGNVMFYSWMDTDPTLATDNQFPNLWAASLDFSSLTNPMAAPATNFTVGGSYDGDNYWLYTAQDVMESGAGTVTYKIPATTSKPWSPTSTGLDAIEHYYTDGMQFIHPVDYVAVPLGNKSIKTADAFSVSQNYPNPFNANTTINVNITEASNLNFAVYNVIGETVINRTTTNAVAGQHTFTVSANDLTPGVYFYTVTAGKNKVTKKMIVE